MLLLLAACHSGTGPDTAIHRSNLLALARSDSADPFDFSMTFHNNVVKTFTWTYSDSAGTTFVVFHFSPQSVVSRNDTLLADTSTVTVSVSATPGVYGFTVTPANMFFNSAGSPTVDVWFTRYADFSVADSASSKYPNPQAFAQALKLWCQNGSDRWKALNTGVGADSVASSALAQPGLYLLAVPK